jgi:hypothetical protein
MMAAFVALVEVCLPVTELKTKCMMIAILIASMLPFSVYWGLHCCVKICERQYDTSVSSWSWPWLAGNLVQLITVYQNIIFF